MSMTDPIADMLTRIRNAQRAQKEEVTMSGSKVKSAIAKVLQSEGYIADFQLEELDGGKKNLTIELKYMNGKPVIEHIKRMSRPGLRRYAGFSDIPEVLEGMGIVVVSTSKGIMSGRSAQKMGLGGELICSVY